MATTLHGPTWKTWIPPVRGARRSLVTALVQSRAARWTDDRNALWEALKFVVLAVPATLSAATQFVLYALSLILFPLAPFLLPVLAAPLLIAFSLIVLGFGAVLTAIGWM